MKIQKIINILLFTVLCLTDINVMAETSTKTVISHRASRWFWYNTSEKVCINDFIFFV